MRMSHRSMYRALFAFLMALATVSPAATTPYRGIECISFGNRHRRVLAGMSFTMRMDERRMAIGNCHTRLPQA